MGKNKRFDVVFSNGSGVFYAGQSLSGCVKLEVSEPTKVKGIKIKLTGEAVVSFNDTTKAKKEHKDKEVYFEQVELLVGKSDASFLGETISLPPGTHEFPFAFNAPNHLPSSFESAFGHVRYYCKVYLNRTWLRMETIKKAFSIVGLLDLNTEPAAFSPANVHAERRFSLTDRLFCCVRGGLEVRVRVDRTGYVPGEQILINAEINNGSSERISKVEAFIQQNIIYSARTGKRFVKGEKKMGLISQGKVQPGKVQIWHQEPLHIPPLPPTRLGGCRLICVEYHLTFLLHVATADNIILGIPLVIGTVPLRQAHREPPPRPPPPQLHPTSPTPSPSAPPLDYTHEPLPLPSAPPAFEYCGPPPSYEECVYMDRGNLRDDTDDPDEEMGGDATYRPLYPTFPSLTMPHPPSNFTLNLI